MALQRLRLAKVGKFRRETHKIVRCLDNGAIYYFCDRDTPYQCLEKMKYTLNLSHRDDSARIDVYLHSMSLTHNGMTYATII